MLPLAETLRHVRLHRLARRYLNPVVVRHGLAGGRASPIGLVLHIGRNSGRTYATPLAVHHRGEQLVIPLTYGPAAHWCRNVQATGECRVRLHGHEYVAFGPRIVGREVLPTGLRWGYRLVGMRQFLELTIRDQQGGPTPSRDRPRRSRRTRGGAPRDGPRDVAACDGFAWSFPCGPAHVGGEAPVRKNARLSSWV